jgi:hypothetical protein
LIDICMIIELRITRISQTLLMVHISRRVMCVEHKVEVRGKIQRKNKQMYIYGIISVRIANGVCNTKKQLISTLFLVNIKSSLFFIFVVVYVF